MYSSKMLKKFKNLNHYFFSKKNGYSSGIYKSLNCGIGSGDNKKNVSKNLNKVAKKLKIKKENLVLMNQTHSNKVIMIKKNFKNSKKINADAIFTNNKNIGLGVLTADCVPILFFEPKKKIVGVIHAGWKGAFSGIIENTFKKVKKITSKNKIYVSIGPSIGKLNYEVDYRFFEKFYNFSKKNVKYFSIKNSDKFNFDLRLFIKDKITKNVICEIDEVKLDTFSNEANFFSYRRSSLLKEKDYGRCISAICIK